MSVINFRNPLAIMTSNISSAPFCLYSPSCVPFLQMLQLLQLSHGSWIFSSTFFLFALRFEKFVFSSSSLVLSLATLNVSMYPSKTFLISVTVFLISKHFGIFGSFLDFHLSAYIPHVFLHVVQFSH